MSDNRKYYDLKLKENYTLHEYLKINSFKEVTGFMKEIIYEEQ